MRRVTVEQRRAALVRRHHLTGDAGGPEEVVAALLALHATDPASVYLSVLARSQTTTIYDVVDMLYRQRRLVRWMAMRDAEGPAAVHIGLIDGERVDQGASCLWWKIDYPSQEWVHDVAQLWLASRPAAVRRVGSRHHRGRRLSFRLPRSGFGVRYDVLLPNCPAVLSEPRRLHRRADTLLRIGR